MMGNTTLEAGKFYRTRDGRKVGPLYLGDMRNEGWHWRADSSLGKWCSAWRADGSFYEGMEHDNDLIAEWNESPVRTVTRKEVVAGTYGRVLVTPVDDADDTGGVCIQLVNRAGIIHGSRDPDPARMTKAECIALAATLTEIAEALEGSA